MVGWRGKNIVGYTFNFGLIIACLIHIGLNLYHNLHPKLPSVRTMDKYLSNITFPISFKICLKEIENKNERYNKLGYGEIWDFFSGMRDQESKDPKVNVGWSGHTEKGSMNLSVKGTFYEILAIILIRNKH